ncbi:MAG: hypothetical protein IPN11_10920 [Opitutaceae bacterium]|nr:hypothetical protein [Opitutaceae bacterium]
MKRIKFHDVTNDELGQLLTPYAKVVGAYLASYSTEQRRQFRDLRGVQGVTTRQRRVQHALREKFSDFNPAGLEEFLREEKAETNKHAREYLDRIESVLRATILTELKEQFGHEETGWWFKRHSAKIRTDVSERFEEDLGKRGGKEHYLFLIQYRTIIQANWATLGPILGYGKRTSVRTKALNGFRN